MSPHSADLLSAAIVAFIWGLFWVGERLSPASARTLGFWAAWYAILAVWNTIDGDVPVTRIMDAGFAGWCAYHAWKRRKPRHRKPSKAAGRVRDLGHRLVVTHG